MFLYKIKRARNLFLNEQDYFLKEIKNRTIQKTNLMLSLQKSFVLKKLWLVLTYRCNLRCKMCGQWGEKGRSKEFSTDILSDELSQSSLQKIIDDIRVYQPNVMLVGGEPLLYKNWYEIAEYIKNQKLRCEMTTNGLLINDNAEKIVKVIDSINISLDGPPEIHNKIRGVDGAFEKVIEGIKKISELKNKDSLKKPKINICCTISEENFSHLKELIEYIIKEKIKIDLLLFQHLEFVPEKILIENNKLWKEKFDIETPYWMGICRNLKGFETVKLIEKIKEIKRNKYRNINFVLFEPDFSDEEIKNFYENPDVILKRFRKKCFSPWQEVFVYPEGNVWTCPGMIMGNVKEKNFKQIWNGEKYKNLRKFLNSQKYFPVCARCANHWHNWSS